MFLSNCLLSSRVLLAGLVVLEAPFLWGNVATSEHVMATCVCGYSLLQGSLDGYLDKSCGFQIHLCIPACIMSGEFIHQVVIKLSTSSVSSNLIFMSSKQFYPFKDVQSDQIQRGYCKKFTAYNARRNANLTL